MLSSEKNDKSITSLEFGEERLFLTIHSEKFDSNIDRTLNYLVLELEDIPIEPLQKIIYPFEFGLARNNFIYTKKNIGKHGDIIEFTANNTDHENAVTFNDTGQTGNRGISWKRETLSIFEFKQSIIEEQLKTMEEGQVKEDTKQILEEQKCTSFHSFEFIIWLEKLTTLIGYDDTVNISIRNDHPMKVMMDFKKLGSSSLEFYLAPRIEEEEFEDDDEDF